MESEPRPAFDKLLAVLRTAGDARMAQRQQRRGQPAVAKAQPSAATLYAEIAQKTAALQAPPAPPAISDEDRRTQLRAHQSEVMARAVQACREGRISVAEVAELQALRMHFDDALDG